MPTRGAETILDRAATRSRRLLLLAVLVMSLPIVLGIVALDRAHARQRTNAGESRLALARAMAGQVEVALEASRNGLRAIASQPGVAEAIASGDGAGIAAIVRNVRESTQFYRAFAVFDAGHQVVAADPRSDLPMFARLADGLDPVVETRRTETDAVVLARYPVRDASGRAVGAVVGAISLDRILGAIGRTRFGETGAASVVDRDANVIVSASPERRGQRLNATEIVALAESGGEGVRRFFSPIMQRDEFGAIAPVDGFDLSVLVTQSEDEVFAVISLFQRGLLAGLVLLALGAGALAWLALRTQQGYQRRILASRGLLEAIIESTTDVVFVKDLEGRYLMTNGAGERYLGRDASRIVGSTDFDLFDRETAERIRATDREAIESAAPTTLRNRNHDAAGVPHLFSTVRAPYRDPGGAVIGVIGVARDVTKEHEDEQTIRRQADELARNAALLTAVAEGTSDAVFAKDLDSRLVMLNRAGAAFLGSTPDALVGKMLEEILRPEEAAAQRVEDVLLLQGDRPITTERTFTLPDGPRTFSMVQAPWRDEHGSPQGVVGIARDVTELERARASLAASEKRHRDLFEMSKGLICVHELDGRLITVNPAAAQMLGYEASELAGRLLQQFVPADFVPEFDRYLAAFAKMDEQQGVLALVARGGEWRYLQYSNRLHEEPGGRRYVIGHATDITERRHYEERLRETSFSDPLTGLRNRRYLVHCGERAGPAARFGAIVIDLDHFKQINDTHGHQRGDEVLVAMGRFLQRHARSGDAVIRMGGDEFLVLLDDADEASTRMLAARMMDDAANAPCGFSIGHAVRERGESLEKMIDRADLTLYRVRVEVRGYERRKH